MRLIDYFDRGADLHPKDLRATYWAGRERKI